MAVSWFDHENAPPGFTGWVHVRASPDYGQNFDSVEVASFTPYCTDNDIAVNNGTIHIAYMDEREGLDHSDVYYRQSLDGCGSWGEEVQLNNDSGWSQGPTIVAIPDWVYVVWEMSDSTGEDLYFIAGEEALGMEAPPAVVAHDVGLQMYPNPANSISVVAFDLPAASDIELSITDLLGRKVANLTEGWLVSGNHRLSLRASDLANGVYWIRLTQGDHQSVKSVTILK